MPYTCLNVSTISTLLADRWKLWWWCEIRSYSRSHSMAIPSLARKGILLWTRTYHWTCLWSFNKTWNLAGTTHNASIKTCVGLNWWTSRSIQLLSMTDTTLHSMPCDSRALQMNLHELIKPKDGPYVSFLFLQINNTLVLECFIDVFLCWIVKVPKTYWLSIPHTSISSQLLPFSVPLRFPPFTRMVGRSRRRAYLREILKTSCGIH